MIIEREVRGSPTRNCPKSVTRYTTNLRMLKTRHGTKESDGFTQHNVHPKTDGRARVSSSKTAHFSEDQRKGGDCVRVRFLCGVGKFIQEDTQTHTILILTKSPQSHAEPEKQAATAKVPYSLILTKVNVDLRYHECTVHTRLSIGTRRKKNSKTVTQQFKTKWCVQRHRIQDLKIQFILKVFTYFKKK